jgi:predicted nucleic acid-binding protein
MTFAVADAGPLIHLHEIDRFSLLQLFVPLYIPDAVWQETVGQGRLTPDDVLPLVDVQRSPLSQSEIDRFIQDNCLEDLQAGECQCLYLCQQIQVPLILTDDLAVRDAAKQLQLTPVGSLGIVVRAYRQGFITLAEAENAITQLYDVSSLFVTRAIVELAIEQLRQSLPEN